MSSELKRIESLSDSELDAELRTYGIDPDDLMKMAFNKICNALRDKCIQSANLQVRVEQAREILADFVQDREEGDYMDLEEYCARAKSWLVREPQEPTTGKG